MEYPTKFQHLTMDTLFGRFPHIVEDIFGQLNGKTLSCCSQINKIWKENLELYRLHIVKKMQKHLKDLNIVIGPVRDFVSHRLPEIIPWEKLPSSFLVQFLRYFCDYKLKDCYINLRIFCLTPLLLGKIGD